MSLRSELEAMLEEFEHFAYRGAPLDVAVEKLQEILARTAPRVLTTVEELDSEETARALCLIPNDGSGPIGFYGRFDGQNHWVFPVGSYHFGELGGVEPVSSAVMLDYVNDGVDPTFTMVEREPEDTK
jgi:hypothetical protein